MILMGPTGNIVKGSVLDCNRKTFARVLRDYDDLLYFKWNPKKNKGNGVWEIRRRPATKSLIDVVPMGDNQYMCRIEAVEYNHIHHVMDAPVLDYKILSKLQAMDLFKYNQAYFVDMAEKRLDQYKQEEMSKTRQEMLYHAKQYRSSINDLRERILSGMDPSEIARYWGS